MNFIYRLDADRGSLVVSGEASERLRILVQQVNENTIEKEDLVYALNNICRTVQSIYLAQKREILDNDSEFSDILNSFDTEDESQESEGRVGGSSGLHEPRVNMVSKEVRSWLETTFTKQANWQHIKSSSPKLTFKQAAIKIKARIKLHR
ncbi:hypothetical protein ACTXT7_000432 [Hymenolepis weldensis]